MNRLIRESSLLILILVLVSEPLYAQQCDNERTATSPDNHFIINGNGTVKDRVSGLMWMRCALGQQWRDQRCAFNHHGYTFVEAREAVSEFNSAGGFSGYRDWRLPDMKELMTIVELRCEDPAINSHAFPDASVTGYWSSQRDPDYSDGAMLIHLLNGRSYMGNINGAWAVRLVRDDH